MAPESSTLGDRPAELEVLIGEAVRSLERSGVASPRVDAEILAAHVLDVSRGRVAALALAGRTVESDRAARLQALVADRARRIPLQHLTGVAPFRGLELRVGPGVFVPRPETEQVAQVALDHLSSRSSRPARVIDLGTGSGALAAALAVEHDAAEVHAVEVSAQAAAWARMNLAPLGVTLHEVDFRELPESWRSSFDVVVSNPPYIPPDMVPTEAEVREHDPQLALYGGREDGLELPGAVIDAAADLLVTHGWFILEHAEVQATEISSRLRADGRFADVRTHQDLSGRDRATSASRAGDADDT